jgi:NhaP-type Na+/H+ or K+/H+ antiporter
MSAGSFVVPLETALFFILLMTYVVVGGYMEHIKVKFGHETGIALVMGLIISAGLHYISSTPSDYDVKFDGTIFFYVCLPPIIFAAGFNMRRRRFFANIGYILLFGVFGTIVTFLVFAGLTHLAMNSGYLTMYVSKASTSNMFKDYQTPG